jgi:hypothetical protein
MFEDIVSLEFAEGFVGFLYFLQKLTLKVRTVELSNLLVIAIF